MRHAHPPHSTISEAVDRNISAIHNLRVDSDEGRRSDQKFVDAVATFLGSPESLYVHVFFYCGWFCLEIFRPIKWTPVDVITATNLSTVASVEAIFLAVFVLINQRRMNTIARKHSDLHLQMTLLTEHEMTRIARATDAIAKHLGVTMQSGDTLDDVKAEINPHEILERISDHEQKAPTAMTNDRFDPRKNAPTEDDKV